MRADDDALFEISDVQNPGEFLVTILAEKNVLRHGHFLLDRFSAHIIARPAIGGEARQDLPQVSLRKALRCGHDGHQQTDPTRCSTHGLSEAHRVSYALADLGDLQWFSPEPRVLREYSQTSVANRMGDHGENFAALINTIRKDEAASSAYVSWLKELTPAELDEAVVLPGAKRDWLFALKRNG
jgi:hypothetical protein